MEQSGYLGVNSLGRRSSCSLPTPLPSDTQAGLGQVEEMEAHTPPPPPVQNRVPSIRADSWGSEPETISALGPGAGEGGGHCGGPGLLPGLGAAQIEEAMNSNKP